MKRLVLLNIYIICIFFVFETLLYFSKLGPVGAWASAHEAYVGGFVFLCAIFSTVVGYFRCKKSKARYSPEAPAAGNLKMGFNLVRARKRTWWNTASLMVFIFCTQMIMFSHLSQNLSMLLTVGLTLIYMVGVATANWMSYRNDKLKFEKARQDQENVSLKLKSIRSQLNPHFMFNALTSIQNLMNKNDISAANHYLTLFADLTRKVLSTSEQDLISLADELKIQEDYLQMEQLRFGFKYNISVSGSINTDNTEIPAMLLQPFIENAVKHGMAAHAQNGMIIVTIDKQNNNLILAIADNGKGFDRDVATNQTTSLGLKLSQQRIELLNQLHKDQPVTLNIDSTPTGTRVTITLVDLLA